MPGARDDVRGATGERRDRDAAARDARALVDDRDAEVRDAEADSLDSATDASAPVDWRTRARSARDAAGRDRRRAHHDRTAARADRLAAAVDRRVAAIDELTGAYRRDPGLLELGHDFDTARDTGQSMVVCFLDVDGLKVVNDNFGHAAGDDVLRRVADTVRQHLRREDILVRYGGDEFVFAAMGLDVPTVLTRIRQIDSRLRDAYGISISCGASLAAGSPTVVAAVERADQDLYRRRARPAPRTRAGGHSATATAVEAYQVAPWVNEAIATVLDDPQSVRSEYQPIVDLSNTDVVGYEALARWPHLPAVDPGAVFDAAAARGVLAEVDWAARLAAIEGALNAGMTHHHRLFLNIEPHSLSATPEYARELIRAATDQLTIVVELTERSLLADPGTLLPQIDQARADGCIIALDDVGANPDSLTLLEFIAPEIIKLDRTLVQRDPTPERARILAAIRAHVDATGAVLLAEGIENRDHVERARAYGCTLGQGWLFGRPAPLPNSLNAAGSRPRWEPPQRRCGTGLVDGRVPATPSDVFGTATPTVGRKSLLVALTRHIEEHAGASVEPLTILSSFQDTDRFTPAIAERYETLAATNPFVAVLGVNMSAEPAPGVRGTAVQPTEPLADEWTITVVGHHHFAALIARDLGDTGDDANRTFEFLHTYDRDVVVAAARSLMHRTLPARTPPASTPTPTAPATAPAAQLLRVVRSSTG